MFLLIFSIDNAFNKIYSEIEENISLGGNKSEIDENFIFK